MILVNRLNKLEVFYHERSVGTMALYRNRLAVFEYDKDILAVAKKITQSIDMTSDQRNVIISNMGVTNASELTVLMEQ